jgi:hypothetical protein
MTNTIQSGNTNQNKDSLFVQAEPVAFGTQEAEENVRLLNSLLDSLNKLSGNISKLDHYLMKASNAMQISKSTT